MSRKTSKMIAKKNRYNVGNQKQKLVESAKGHPFKMNGCPFFCLLVTRQADIA